MTLGAPTALGRCVGDPDRFVTEVWGRRSLHHHHDAGFADLFTFENLDYMLSGMGLRLPAFRLVKDGKTVPTSQYTKGGRIGSVPVTGVADPARIFHQFQDGATIVLQGMHRFWPPLANFCRDLEMDLGHPTQVNGYVTPPGSRGFGVHADPHDVFVLQAFGRKHWEVHDPETSVAEAKATKPQLSVELRAGDSLYIPRGAPHAARTQSDVSGHLTVGILTYTWSDVLREVMTLVDDEETFRERLPLSFHRDEESFASAVETKLDELSRWIEKLDPDGAASMMVRKFLTSRPSLLSQSLQGLLETDAIRDDSLLRRRRRSILHLQIRGDSLRALLGDRELQMPARLLPAMELIEERQEFRLLELSPWLDPESRLVLARRLVREGLLEPAPPVEH